MTRLSPRQRWTLATIIADCRAEYAERRMAGYVFVVTETGRGLWASDALRGEREGDAADYVQRHPAYIAAVAIVKAQACTATRGC